MSPRKGNKRNFQSHQKVTYNIKKYQNLDASMFYKYERASMKNVHGKTINALFTMAFLFNSIAVFGSEYTVSSDQEFNDLTLVAGDVVTWLDGTYADQGIEWSGQQGTAENPIILKAETPGGVIFTGSSKINFYGSHLIVDGFYWKGGEGASNHIEFRDNGSNVNFGENCTLRNCAFDNLYTDEPDKSRWIVLYGSGNVIENCSFLNKESAGALILVELAYTEGITPGHIIRNNYFYNITPKDHFATNSGDCEAIRIGVSSDQAVSAQVVVEGNYFKAADGENEIITNKSADNIYSHNTFRNCRGSLVLRHGARAHVAGNFFLGEGKAKSGGIRISDRDHVIINNYMQGLSNDNDVWNNGITLVGGGESSGGTGNGYQNVDNVTIAHNTIYNSDDPIFFNDRNSYDPTGVIAYNLIYSENGDIVSGDIAGTGQGMTYEGNIFGGSNIGISEDGIEEGNGDFSLNGEMYKPSATGIAADAAGSAYSTVVNIDVEGFARPNTDLDVGAHEVSGGIGNALYAPITDGDVGASVGACFLDAAGNVLSACGAVGDYLVTPPVIDFTDEASTKSASITSNVSWTLSDDQDWINVSPASGTGSENIEVTVTANASTSERIGTITVTGSGVEEQIISVTQAGYVPPIDVTGVSVDPENALIAVGGTQQLEISIEPSDATNQEVSFSSDDEAVATVSTTGLVTAVATGTATITITTDDGGFTATSAIEVNAPSTGFNWALNQPVTATGSPDGDNVPSNLVDGDVASRWSVSGFPQSATIDLGGDITINQTEVTTYDGRAYQYIIEGALTEDGTYTTIVDRSKNTTPGEANIPIIDAVANFDARYVKMTVSGADQYSGDWVSITELRIFGEGEREVISVSGVALDQSNLELLEGATQQLTATVSPANATDKAVSFSSSNTAVATVTTGGLVTAVTEGTATITVTTNDGGFTDATQITVTREETEVLGVRDMESKLKLSPNPAKFSVSVKGAAGYHSLLVYDQTGRILIKRKIESDDLVDVTSLQPGIYVFKFIGNGTHHVQRLIKR